MQEEFLDRMEPYKMKKEIKAELPYTVSKYGIQKSVKQRNVKKLRNFTN